MHLVQGADCDCFCTQALSVWHLGPSSMAEILCAMKTRSQKRCSSWLLHAFSSTSPCSEDLSAWDALQNPARAPDLTFWRFSSKCLGEEGKHLGAFSRGWVTLKAKACQCTWLFLVSLCHAVTGAHRAIDHPPLGYDRPWPQLQQRPSQCSVGANCVQYSNNRGVQHNTSLELAWGIAQVLFEGANEVWHSDQLIPNSWFAALGKLLLVVTRFMVEQACSVERQPLKEFSIGALNF